MGETRKALLIEDELFLNQLYCELISSAGINVDAVHNGKEALEFMEKNSYDLVVSGIMLPKLNGLDVLEIASNMGIKPDNYWILTNLNQEVVKEKAQQYGIRGYLVKSELTPNQILDALSIKIDENIDQGEIRRSSNLTEEMNKRKTDEEEDHVPTELDEPVELQEYEYIDAFKAEAPSVGFGRVLMTFVGYLIIAGLLGGVIIAFIGLSTENDWLILLGSLVFLSFVVYMTTSDFVGKTKTFFFEKVKNNDESYSQLHSYAVELYNQKEESIRSENIWKASLRERGAGFPTLLENIEYYENLKDKKLSNYLTRKKRPAKKAAEIVKEESRRRREAEKEAKKIKSYIEYYENIAPFLLDFKDELIDESNEILLFEDYDEQSETDPVNDYLAKEEYKKLSTTERNQLALDRFIDRPKSKWLIGKLYEQYVGYLYEKEGYKVEYVGITMGKSDLGRDLICTKGNKTIVIQCKNWSQFKTIYEKHIFQFFGTVFQFRDKSKGDVKAIFYTTTQLSDLARRFAKELNIELVEGHKFDKRYPQIKCNISKDGTKIYHLPFDQQYDNTAIEPNKGEFYAQTVKEAEDAGFRRAFRWSGNDSVKK